MHLKRPICTDTCITCNKLAHSYIRMKVSAPTHMSAVPGQRPLCSRPPSQPAALRAVPRRQQLQARAAFEVVSDASTGALIAYTSLGAGLTSFVGTFFVAPRFKDSFKEELDWASIYNDLTNNRWGRFDTVTAEQAYSKTRSGAVLLDTRLARKYEQSHPEGAVNVPLYNPIQKWDLASNIRRAGFAFFGIYGTELNKDFVKQAEAAIPKDRDVYVLCEMGGTLENKPGTNTGFQSRSLKAIHALQKAGYRKLHHVKGGLIDWNTSKLPMSE